MKKTLIEAKGYRVQRMILKDLIKTVLTLGIKRPKLEPEQAKTYIYRFVDRRVIIKEEGEPEQTKTIKTLHYEAEEDIQKILSKGKFVDERHVYYVDKETIRDM
ncbi:hypothetical protein GCM10008932_00140 [Alkalibacterium iburiense]|uniref:Uncharacterized protein n=1 Tax=Alkalibacterium iburiense TaxID=290589 RepID=A0ABP3GS30_9LACT